METLSDLGHRVLEGGLPETITRFVGGSPSTTKRTLEAAMPTAMLAITDHGSTESGARDLLEGMRNGTAPYINTKELGDTLGDVEATDRLMMRSGGFLDRTFGANRLSGIIGGMSAYGGADRVVTAKIMALVTPLALGLVARRARDERLDERGLASFLRGQRGAVAEMVPEPLHDVMGLRRPDLEHERYRDIATADTQPVAAQEEMRREEVVRQEVVHEPRRVARGGRSVWPWVFLGLAALFGLGWLLTRALPTARAPRIPVPSETIEQSAMSMRDLPAYLASADNAPRRFVLDGVGFQQGGAALTADGLRGVDNLAAQLSKHPEAKLRIEGYTEAGNSADMESLSKARADAVRDRLIARGIDADRIETVGMGAQRPVASNENPAGRAQNRRIELVVDKG